LVRTPVATTVIFICRQTNRLFTGLRGREKKLTRKTKFVARVRGEDEGGKDKANKVSKLNSGRCSDCQKTSQGEGGWGKSNTERPHSPGR
jgi:hypothetical protein